MTNGSVSTLLLATSNAGKRIELQLLLGDAASVRTLEDLKIASPPETGTTLASNAVLKAEHGARLSGLLTLADDSGLEVAALDDRPGVLSARFAGDPPNEAENRALLLRLLHDIPVGRRSAQFVCAIALATPKRLVGVVEGVCAGEIAIEEKGQFGFGYDSIFMLPDGRTMAEMSLAEKNQISHRAEALRRALPMIKDAISEARS